MRELAQLERARARARHAAVEDAEFVDRPIRALARRERVMLDDDRADRDDGARESRSSFWVPLAVGLGIIAVVGVAGVIVYLLARRDGDKITSLGAVDPRHLLPAAPAPAAAPAAAPQIYVINAGSGTVSSNPPTAPEANGPAKPVAYPSTTPSLHRLPPATNAAAAAIATAGAHTIEVNVAVLEPSGATALLAFSPDLSERPMALRVGEERRIRIDRHQTLYGKGQTGYVTVTLASTS